MSGPRVTFIIPTLNSARSLGACLDSIVTQDVPRATYRILIVDAGSTDETVAIAQRYGVDDILPNPGKTGEAGKSVGLAAATTELVAFVDSDNLLEGPEWLRRMLAPFDDPEIHASEVDRFTYRRQDSLVDRYCALMGLNDPIHLFVGNYGRLCALTGNWTGWPHTVVAERDGYTKIRLDRETVPTLGANGFVVKRAVLRDVCTQPFYFDIDVRQQLVEAGHDTFGLVHTGVVHLFCPDVRTYIRKQRRRIKDYLYYRAEGQRTYRHHVSPWGYVLFIVATLTLLPVVLQACIGWVRRPERAWFFHPVACWITLGVYGMATVQAAFRPRAETRQTWSQ